MRVHGPIDGILVTVYRALYRRRLYRVGYAVQWLSDRLETFWFLRLLSKHEIGAVPYETTYGECEGCFGTVERVGWDSHCLACQDEDRELDDDRAERLREENDYLYGI